MKRKPPTFDLHIPNPCTQPWSGMTGTTAQRHCESCNKQVHNLAALTQSQIEVLLLESNGNLCARISRSPDGTLVMQPSRRTHRAPMAAGFVLAASLTAASAQSAPDGQAILSGNILTPQGYAPEGKYGIKLSQNDNSSITVITDEKGSWHTALPPGTYDLQIFPLTAQGSLAIPAVTLHTGQQSLQNIRTKEWAIDTVAGEIIGYKVSWGSMLVKHPIVSIKAFSRRYL